MAEMACMAYCISCFPQMLNTSSTSTGEYISQMRCCIIGIHLFNHFGAKPCKHSKPYFGARSSELLSCFYQIWLMILCSFYVATTRTAWGCCQDVCPEARIAYEDFAITLCDKLWNSLLPVSVCVCVCVCVCVWARVHACVSWPDSTVWQKQGSWRQTNDLFDRTTYFCNTKVTQRLSLNKFCFIS